MARVPEAPLMSTVPVTPAALEVPLFTKVIVAVTTLAAVALAGRLTVVATSARASTVIVLVPVLFVGVGSGDGAEVDHGSTVGPVLMFAGRVAYPLRMGLGRIPIAI